MLVSYKWLQELVDIDGITPEQLADKLTFAGVPVEHLTYLGEGIEKVVTGKITGIDPHPDADRLRICYLDCGTGDQLQIVTGADNVQPGQVVPVALHGSLLPGGTKIKKGKLRGVESNGMLCSAQELNIDAKVLPKDQSEGIYILPPETPVGLDIKQVLGLDDVIMELELTPNRADCLNMLGVAREVAALFERQLKFSEPKAPEVSKKIKGQVDVEIEASDLCKRYVARIIENVTIGPSPAWMQERLRAVGIRSISNVVDITNYVMMEMGQPLHAFDAKTIAGNKIIVRRAKAHEKLVTLDEQERQLDTGMLVIADSRKPVALAGVMGGLDTEVTDQTTTILLESAYFEGVTVRQTSRKLGLRSESSTRYEKGIDPDLAHRAANRAAELFTQYAGGHVLAGYVDQRVSPYQPAQIKFSPAKVCQYLGIDIPVEEMLAILKRLQLAVKKSKDSYLVTVPSFRPDLTIEVDLIEEIARIYGYDKIPATLPQGATTQGKKTQRQVLYERAKAAMNGLGMNEILTLSFANPGQYDKLTLSQEHPLRNMVVLANPMGEEQSTLRTSLIPGMLEVVARNLSRRIASMDLFETGHVFLNQGSDRLPEEVNRLCFAALGAGPLDWQQKPVKKDFYYLKGILETLLAELGVKQVSVEPETDNVIFHPGRAARVLLAGVEAGTLGQIHPDVAANYGIEAEVYLAELDLEEVFAQAIMAKRFKPLPKFPGTERDLAVIVEQSVSASSLIQAAKEKGTELLREVKIFDVYQGSQIQAGYKSIAVAFAFQASDRTLTDEEINAIMENIQANLADKLGAKLR